MFSPSVLGFLTLTDKGTYTSNLILQKVFSPAISVVAENISTDKDKNTRTYLFKITHESGDNIEDLHITYNVQGENSDVAIKELLIKKGKINSNVTIHESKTEAVVIKSLLPQHDQLLIKISVTGTDPDLDYNIYANEKIRIINPDNKSFKDSWAYKNFTMIFLIVIGVLAFLIVVFFIVEYYLGLLTKSGYYPNLKFDEVQEKLGKYDNIYFMVFLFSISMPLSLFTKYDFSLFHIVGIYFLTTRFRLVTNKIDEFLVGNNKLKMQDSKSIEKVVTDKSIDLK